MHEPSTRNPAVFTPAAVAAINRAYTRACTLIGRDGAKQDLRHRVAERMMDLAKAGETDEGRLCELSVREVLDRVSARPDQRPRAD